MAEYLPVVARFDTDGTVTPLSFTWPDGRTFSIDRILDVCQAASRKQGGCGTRYLCRVRDRKILLYREDTRWFYGRVPQ